MPRIVCISDTHGQHFNLIVQAGDARHAIAYAPLVAEGEKNSAAVWELVDGYSSAT